jgi:hypothetical protein
MAPSLRCPRCATVVPVVAGVDPVCPSCGFTGAAPASATAGAPAAVPAAAMVPPALSAPPLGTPAGLSPMAPVAGGPSPQARGKVVHPGLVVLFHIITLGIYFFVFWWRTSREADEATLGAARAHKPAKAGILMMVIAGVLLVLTAVAGIVFLVGNALLAEESGETSEEDLFREFLAAGIAFVFAIVVLVLVVLAGRITLLVGQYRLWKATHGMEVAAGVGKPIGAGLMLALSIVAMLLGGGNNANSAAEMAVSGALSLVALALYLTVAALTQSHLNRVWQAPAAAPVPAPGAPPAGW